MTDQASDGNKASSSGASSAGSDSVGTDGDEATDLRPELLRLRAHDPDDLQVIAACLQDALVPLREMAYMADEHRFMAAFNRFQWEKLTDPEDCVDLMITQSVLRIDHVDAVQYRGLDSELDGVKFELLTIQAVPLDETGFQVTLLFAGDVALRLQVRDLAIMLQDFEKPWPANVTPQHDLADSTEEEA